jgi:hypothetical protein
VGLYAAEPLRAAFFLTERTRAARLAASTVVLAVAGVSTGAGFAWDSAKESERPSIPDGWLRLPTVKSLGLLRTDARG